MNKIVCVSGKESGDGIHVRRVSHVLAGFGFALTACILNFRVMACKL